MIQLDVLIILHDEFGTFADLLLVCGYLNISSFVRDTILFCVFIFARWFNDGLKWKWWQPSIQTRCVFTTAIVWNEIKPLLFKNSHLVFVEGKIRPLLIAKTSTKLSQGREILFLFFLYRRVKLNVYYSIEYLLVIRDRGTGWEDVK